MLFQAKQSYSKVTWRHLCTFWRCMQVKRYSCVNLIEQNALPCRTVWMALGQLLSPFVKWRFIDCMLQNQDKNFYSPASHVVISKTCPRTQEMKHYCPFQMHIWRLLPRRKKINYFRQCIICWICLTISARVFLCLLRVFLTIWSNVKL